MQLDTRLKDADVDIITRVLNRLRRESGYVKINSSHSSHCSDWEESHCDGNDLIAHALIGKSLIVESSSIPIESEVLNGSSILKMIAVSDDRGVVAEIKVPAYVRGEVVGNASFPIHVTDRDRKYRVPRSIRFDRLDDIIKAYRRNASTIRKVNIGDGTTFTVTDEETAHTLRDDEYQTRIDRTAIPSWSLFKIKSDGVKISLHPDRLHVV